MEKTARIQTIGFVDGWQGNDEMLYYHEIIMDNGDQGKLDRNNQPRPAWLQENAEIVYSVRQGKRGPLITFVRLASAKPAVHTSVPGTTYRPFEHNQDKKNKYSNDPEWREKQQKCISLTTCLDRANELVIADKIKLKERHDYALEDFKFILRNSGIEVSVSQEEIESKTVRQAPAENKPNTVEQPALFQDKPIPIFILQCLERCKNKKQLDNFKSQLTEEEMNSDNIQNAVRKKALEIAKTK